MLDLLCVLPSLLLLLLLDVLHSSMLKAFGQHSARMCGWLKLPAQA
jgi:hypothetical protein